MHLPRLLPPDQRLDLCKLNPSDSDAVRGQVVGEGGHALLQNLEPAEASAVTTSLFSVSLQTRDRIGSGGPVVDCRGLLENDGSVLVPVLFLLILSPSLFTTALHM